MKDISNLSNASDYFNFNSNNISGISKNNNLNITKLSNESNEFKELNKEIFQTIQQGGNLSGVNNTYLTISSNNNSNSLPSFNDINWKKKVSHENSSFFDRRDGNNSSLSNVSSIIPKKQIEVLNMRNTFDEKDMNINYNNNNNNNGINNNVIINNNNNINFNNNYNNKNYNKFSLIPEDSQEEIVENKISFNNVKKINNKNDSRVYNNMNNHMGNNHNNINNNSINNNNMNNMNNMNNINNNNMMMNNMLNINSNINLNNNKNFVKKSNYQMMANNNNNNNSNIMMNNMRNQIPQNSNPNFLYYQNPNINNINNFFYNNNSQQYMFPENAFSYNNTNINQSQNNHQNNNQNNWKDSEKKNKNKKKFKDKIEQKLFVIDLDNIIKGTDERTTVMIRHIPNKYTSQTLLEELNMVCKNKYDFFYLPIDNDNDCNLGYAFINFINPLHIVHFYHIFKARKWKLYKSNKECDLTFAKFQGKSELTANLDKNMNKIEDKKKLPMVFEVMNPPKIDLEKKYYDEIKMNRSELLKSINWI